ncbi:hypothetical protein FNV43_RR10850 [Rhamnella rubrinervis]|uniref:WAT1-related protein n=1 Tax=Rhamnella rubrinervis TaxID=2594499 RepID=A0A8K0H4V4_9ROSA|nr:hypothetical protein FNV43_RR10850 [Rhamnella rubrinervis]
MGDETTSSYGKVGMMLKKAKPYVLVVGLQFGFAGMYIIGKNTLNQGLNRYVLVVYRNAFAALLLSPFALLFERPVLDQGFGYLGMKFTSATFASAIMNAVPSVTFVIAVIFRLERLKIKEVRGQAKLIGTLVTFAGALLMTMYKGPVVGLFSWSSKSIHHASSSGGGGGDASEKHLVAGTLLLFLACAAWSCFYVLQSITLKKYPAGLSLTVLICMFGGMQAAAIAIAVERRPSAWILGWDSRLWGCMYLGVFGSGIAYYVQGIVMKTRGPVFVTAFNPLCMIIVAVLGSIVLAEKIHLGSVIGGIIIAMGLYTVVWGKSKDYSDPQVEPTSSATIAKGGEPQELPLTSPPKLATTIVIA